MNKNIYISARVALIQSIVLHWTITVQAQPMLDNAACGRIVNTGRIEVRGSLSSTRSATIDNRRGVITISGDGMIEQPLLEGRTEFVGDTVGARQRIPQISYSVLYFRGQSMKGLDILSGRSLECIDTLIVEKPSEIRINRTYPIIARGRVHHDGSVNNDGSFGEIILRSTSLQQLSGRGVASAMQIDNRSGVLVTDSANIRVRHTLFLNKGELRNSTSANIEMLAQSMVIRTDSSSVLDHFFYNLLDTNGYSVQYQGQGLIVTGNEIPKTDDELQSLTLLTPNGLQLDRNVTVNDSLIVGTTQYPSFIYTERDSATRYILTYVRDRSIRPILDPLYQHPRSEVIGSLRRVGLLPDSIPQLYTNRYTWIALRTSQNHLPSSVTVRSLAGTFPPYPDGDSKVRRALFVEAIDRNGNPLASLPYTFGYAWLDQPPDLIADESNGLDRARVILLRWNGSRWQNIYSSRTPAQSDTSGWAYSLADTISQLGPFAMGYSAPTQVCLATRVLLEGPYRHGVMSTDLARRRLIPQTPPNIYPYNLDPNRTTIRRADNDTTIVDWVVVELRPSLAGINRIYKTALLRSDGTIVDINGNSRLCYDQNIDTTSYFVALHHRNHLAVISAEANRLVGEDQQMRTLFLSAPSQVLGGASVLKPIDYDPDGGVIFGMVAGDVNGDGVIDINDRSDYDAIWSGCVEEGYLNRDSDLSGIVTTRDANKTWNNRGRTSNVP